jgi:hypothetical protein
MNWFNELYPSRARDEQRKLQRMQHFPLRRRRQRKLFRLRKSGGTVAVSVRLAILNRLRDNRYKRIDAKGTKAIPVKGKSAPVLDA